MKSCFKSNSILFYLKNLKFKKPLLILIIFFSAGNLMGQNPFVTIWKTDNPGSSNDNQIKIPTATAFGFTYDYTVDWGDGTSDTGITGDIIHTYSSSGTYQVSISGQFPAIRFGDAGDKQKILRIDAWGDIQWESMNRAFNGCENLIYNASDAPDLSNTTTLFRMFSGATNFNGDLNNWDVSTITNMDQMFYQAKFFNGNVSNWDVSAVDNMRYMFSQTDLFNGDLSNWDVSKVEDMSYMFNSAKNFNQDISTWDVGAATTMNSMFFGATKFNADLSSWNVSSVTDMSAMFYNAEAFNSELNNWNVSNVNSMSAMFSGAIKFNSNLNNWDVSNVTNMSYMFNGCTVFNGDVSSWNTSIVSDMSFMFRQTDAFNQDIGSWDVSNVTNMSAMFNQAIKFNQDLSSWNVANVTDMSHMFSSAVAFNQNINLWNTSSVINMKGMFSNLSLFNQPLNNWETGNVTDMSFMFRFSSEFNQDISAWDISKVTTMEQMLNSTALKNYNYDKLLNSWASKASISSVAFGVTGVSYCLAEASRNILTNSFGWVIDDAGIDCTKSDQIITFESLMSVVIGDSNFELEGSASSGLNLNYVSSNPAVASISGSTVTINGVGTTTITATQNGDSYFNAANSVDQTLIVKDTQTITFSALGNVTYGDDNFELSAVASSNLPITYTSADPSIATISGNTVTIVGAGSTSITASQSGNDNFAAAPDVSQLLIVNKSDQTISFNEIANSTYGDADFTIDASASSGLPVSFTSSNPSVALINQGVIEITGVGITSITASQTGDDNYNAAISVIQTLTVEKSNQTIIFQPFDIKTILDPDFEIEASSSSSLSLEFKSSDESVARVNGTMIEIVGVGTTVITANQPGDSNFEPAEEVRENLTITKATQVITFNTLPELGIGALHQLEATSSSGLLVSFISSNNEIASVDDSGVLRIHQFGDVTITAIQNGDNNFLPAVEASQLLTIESITSAENG
ncbi:BspA family leucine-rich repeat surface protein, partial [Fulvivirga lutimaris]|uniref:BspA family leucine-rich repeat surface protein n=1 Tax=Fulvivirga lutimaris TaxID=1819566 RepID=UPI0012BD479A